MNGSSPKRIGIIHPGAMGVSVAASARNNGNFVYWASEGRSAATRQRAAEHSITDLASLVALCANCELILSICPPDAAEDVAQSVIANHFRGLYCDANAISPERAERIGASLAAAGVDFVDGGIIGPPAWKPNATWLYLSGARADEVARCFSAGPLESEVIGAEPGKASALKMCYAAYTKGTTALLCGILGTSENLGVRAALYAQWMRDDPEMVREAENRARLTTKKAWRFEGEMREIAATFASAGMPAGFHQAAAEIFHRLAPLKEKESVSLEDVLGHLDAFTPQTS